MKNKTPVFTFLDHTADLMVRIRGNSLTELFENAGRAFIHLLIRTGPGGKPDYLKVSLTGTDLEDLMVRWLSEILYLLDGENLAVTSVRIDSIYRNRLESTLGTYRFNPNIHELLTEIKAVTYHQIKVTEKRGIWEATITFDT